MKNFMTNGFLVLLCFSVISCTEQIAEEVKSSETLSGSDSNGSSGSFVSGKITVENTMDESLSYYLHKSGTKDEPCKLDAPDGGFSSLDYDKSSSTYTTDCIIDAQEYDLFFSGAKFKVVADEFVCDYIGYKPFRFFGYQPGESSLKQYKVNCDSTCSSELSICGDHYKSVDITMTTNDEYCDSPLYLNSTDCTNAGKNWIVTSPKWVVDTANLGLLFREKISSIKPLSCRFDYSEDEPIAGPNCDEGNIITEVVELKSRTISAHCSNSAQLNEEDCTTAGANWTEEATSCLSNKGKNPEVQLGTTTEAKCGGKFSSCLAGPGAEELGENETTLITQLKSIDPSVEDRVHELSYEVPSPISKGYLSNMYIANFSRICSSTENKTNSEFDTTINTILGHQVEDMPQRSEYNGYEVSEDLYNNDVDYTVMGVHPFKSAGYYSDPSRNVQPYYAIECLDQARDVKAQIRIFIRDWDREFDNNNAYIGLVSDVNQSTPLMDSNGDQLIGEQWNDRADWDDLFGDYDMDTTQDYSGDGNKLDKAFTNNSCEYLDYGQCSNPIYTDEETCTLNSQQWTLGHCSDPTHINEATCDAASETWYASWSLFPQYRL